VVLKMKMTHVNIALFSWGSSPTFRYVGQNSGSPLHFHTYFIFLKLAITAGETTTITPPYTYEPRIERPKHRIKDTDFGLPHGVHDNNDWHKKFIPTYKKWLGTRAKPWVIDKHESIAALQVIWRAVYPHIDYIIDVNCPVDCMVSHVITIHYSS